MLTKINSTLLSKCLPHLLRRSDLHLLEVSTTTLFSNNKCNFHLSAPFSAHEFIEDVLGKGEKIVKTNIPSTRMDTILKAALKISKNKIEKHLFDDRIRVDGERPEKKSQEIFEGQSIDLVRKINEMNPKFLDVTRVEVIDIEYKAKGKGEDEDSDDDAVEGSIPAVLKTYKLLTIDNYPQPWKGNPDE